MAIYLILFIAYLNSDTNTEKMEKLVIGSTVPKFELKDQHGQLFSIDSVLGKKNLVIYFYPKEGPRTMLCFQKICPPRKV